VVWSAETVLACSLTLLNRSPTSFPAVAFVDVRPSFVSASANAYVVDGREPIYLVTTTRAFIDARRAINQCGDLQDLRKIASILIHEEWHLRHGPDEASAYQVQLTTLASLGAGPGTPLFAEVYRSMRIALRQSRP
jgi:hypothetical protein